MSSKHLAFLATLIKYSTVFLKRLQSSIKKLGRFDAILLAFNAEIAW